MRVGSWQAVAAFGAVLASVAVLAPSDAATMRTWYGGTDTNWSSATNWNVGGPPEDGDYLTIGKFAPAATLNNDIQDLSLQRITLDGRDYVLTGNPITLGDLLVSDGGIITYNTITFDIAGPTQILVSEDGALQLSGTNTFTGDIDVYGRLRAESNSALGSAAGRTRVNAGGTLSLAGRDLGGEVVQLSSGDISFAQVESSLDSVIPNLEVGGLVGLLSSGRLNLPNGLKELFPGTEAYLSGSGEFLVGGMSTATGTLHLVQAASLTWNSTSELAIVSGGPIVETPPTGDLSGAGTAASLDFHGGLFRPGNGDDSGRFILSGALSLEDATLQMLLNGSTTGTGYSQVRAGGPITIGPDTHLDFVLGFEPNTGQAFRIIDNTGAEAVAGTFAGLAEGATFTRGGRTFTITYEGGDGNDVEVTVTADAPTDPRPYKARLPMLARG